MDGWLYDESKHCGVDYSKAEQARAYEERHRKFRDFRKEFDDMMAFLELSHPERQSLVDLGCGTGAMAIYAAEVFGQVTGVDISEAMLAQAARCLDRVIFECREIEREVFAEGPVLDRVGVGVGCGQVPR